MISPTFRSTSPRPPRRRTALRHTRNCRAAGSIDRDVTEATARDKGITSGNWQSKITATRTQQLLRPGVATMAHEVRYAGNDMAQGGLQPPDDQRGVRKAARLYE